MDRKELHQIQERVGRLTPEEQLYLLERLAANLRKCTFSDPAALDRELAAMAEDPGIRRELEAWRAHDAGDDVLKLEVQRGVEAADRGEVVDGPTFMRDLLARTHRRSDQG